MEHGPAAATAADKADNRCVGRVQEGKVDFDPGVLVTSDDNAGAVCVQEEHDRLFGGGLEEVVLDREVEEGRVRGGDVDLEGRP